MRRTLVESTQRSIYRHSRLRYKLLKTHVNLTRNLNTSMPLVMNAHTQVEVTTQKRSSQATKRQQKAKDKVAL